MNNWTAVTRMTRTELRLVLREPLVLAFVLFFPVVFTLVLGGVFDPDDEAFGTLPSDYYGVAYVAVAIGAIGLTMVPVQVASYRERGVLRRFRTSGIAPWVFPLSTALVGVAMAVVATGLVVVTSLLSYGLSAPADWGSTIVMFTVATTSFLAFGVFLGWLMPNARAAQGIGTLAFFPMFLLGGGGPPPDAFSSTMNTIATWLPLTHVLRAIQEPWLDLGDGTDHLVILTAIGVGSAAGTWLLARRGSV